MFNCFFPLSKERENTIVFFCPLGDGLCLLGIFSPYAGLYKISQNKHVYLYTFQNN